MTNFRERVEKIADKDKRVAFQAMHLLCGRVGEVVTEKYASDFTCNPTGSKLCVSKAVYQPDLNNPLERDTWTFIKLLAGKPVDYQEIGSIREEVAVFDVSTEKRMGLMRTIGLPLDEKYDPWVRQVYDYLDGKKKSGFQFTRQEMWVAGKAAFEGFTYKIHPYRRAVIINGEYQYDGEGPNRKLKKYIEGEKAKGCSDHWIRHLRNLELKQFYGLSPEERAGYGGWKLATVSGTSAAQDQYEESPWRVWFPKMLKVRA